MLRGSVRCHFSNSLSLSPSLQEFGNRSPARMDLLPADFLKAGSGEHEQKSEQEYEKEKVKEKERGDGGAIRRKKKKDPAYGRY